MRNRLKVTQKLVMEKLKSIENERTKSEETFHRKESVTAELDSDSDDSDSCISINDSSSEEEAVNNLAERAVQKKTLNRKPVFKKNAKNFKKFQKPEMPKSFQRRNKQLQMQRKKKRFFTSK